MKVIDEALVIAKQIGAIKMQGTLYLNQGNINSVHGQSGRARWTPTSKALKIGAEAGLVGPAGHGVEQYRRHLPDPQGLPQGRGAGASAPWPSTRKRVSWVAWRRRNAISGFALMGQGRIKEGAAEVQAALKLHA